jgi:hypothetical protein
LVQGSRYRHIHSKLEEKKQTEVRQSSFLPSFLHPIPIHTPTQQTILAQLSSRNWITIVTVVVVVRAPRASPKRKTNLRERDSSSSSSSRESEFPKDKNPNFQKQKHKKRDNSPPGVLFCLTGFGFSPA